MSLHLATHVFKTLILLRR